MALTKREEVTFILNLINLIHICKSQSSSLMFLIFRDVNLKIYNNE